MNYSSLDILSVFTPATASNDWCESEGWKSDDDYNRIYMEIITGLKNGEIKTISKPPNKRISGNPYMEEAVYGSDFDKAEFTRDELIKFAERKGHKPKFLFPKKLIGKLSVMKHTRS